MFFGKMNVGRIGMIGLVDAGRGSERHLSHFRR